MTVDTKNWVPDWALDMARVPFDPNAERAAANFSTGGPIGMIPRATTAPAPVPPANTNGWQADHPLVNPDAPAHPTPGVALIDRMVIAADQRERQQAQQPADSERMMEIMMKMMQMQSQTLQAVAAAILRDDKGKPKPKSKPEAKAK